MLIKDRAKVNLEGVVIVDFEYEEADGESAKESSDVRENFVQLLVAPTDMDGVWGFVNEEGAIVIVVRAHLESILYCIFCDYSSFFGGEARKGRYAVISLDLVVLHHQLCLLPASLGEDDIVRILEIVGQELGAVWIEERVKEVYRKKDLLRAVYEVLIDGERVCAGTRVHG
jgi:hypothetical protein